MLKRLILVWFIANLFIVGAVSWISGSWYLAWPPVGAILAELGLIMLPNFLLSILVLRFGGPARVENVRVALGWQWSGGRTLAAGAIAFTGLFAISAIITQLFGQSIPYQLPGRGGIGPVQGLPAIFGVLILLSGMIFVTVLGEETMFRGLIQTQVGREYGWLAGLLAGAVFFGLRHLPADIFYAGVWSATPQMWLSRELQLYSGALIFGLARQLGRSTYASAIAHALFFLVVLLSG